MRNGPGLKYDPIAGGSAIGKKKILILHLHLRPGGVERQLYYLLNGLRLHHHVWPVLCEKKGDFIQFLDSGLEVKDLGIACKYRLQPTLLFRMFRAVQEIKPEILISYHGRLNWMAVLLAKLTGIRVVCLFHGYLRRGNLWWLHNLMLRMANGLVAVSASVKNSLIENFGLENSSIRVIENAIDYRRVLEMAEEDLSTEEKDIFDLRPTIVSIGRLEKGKGFDVLIEAMAEVRTDCRLFIIGDGSKRPKLENQVRLRGLSNRVSILGTQDNPFKFLKRASVFALASESEGLPNVILEAMSLGVPCICTNYRGGTEGLISHMENGYLVKVNDPLGLGNAIDLLLSAQSHEMRESFSRAGKALVRKKFSIEHCIRSYSEYLNGI